MKLHELLAVETGLENQANKTRNDLINTFDKKRHLFEEKRTVFTPLGEGAQSVTESQSDIQSTVAKELNWVQGFMAKAIDASYQVAQANTLAKADVVLEDDNGTVLLEGVPATSLLELEKRLAEVQALVNAIPTLDPAKGFSPDPQRGEGYFLARPIKKHRTRKEKKVLVKYEATKEHPAQTELIDQDTVIGSIEEQEWSGLMTPAQKSELINRVEIVSRAVRKARSRANEQEVTNVKIGSKLLGYIFNK
jgi:hypothetical protein